LMQQHDFLPFWEPFLAHFFNQLTQQNVIALSYLIKAPQQDLLDLVPFGAIQWCIAADLKEKLPCANLQWPH